jgi:hypothetical protein
MTPEMNMGIKISVVESNLNTVTNSGDAKKMAM